MLTIIFAGFIFTSILLGQKYSKLEKEFFALLESLDSSMWNKSDNAFKNHVEAMKFFKNKPYLTLENEELNQLSERLTVLGRFATISILIGVVVGVYQFYSFWRVF